MDTTTWVRILYDADCISHRLNNIDKGMNPIILPPAMSEYLGRRVSIALVRQLV